MIVKRTRFTTMQILVVGFLAVIFAGGFLLWLPISNQQPITFVDAMFTSVTSICVTGLVTVVPATQFTLFGKIILLILIQIGGLGIMACAIAVLLILKKRIGVKERQMIREAYSMDSLAGMVAMIIRVFKGTFLVEGIGAFLYAFQFVPEYGLARGIGYSVFHSVSAFCNAGIDILGDSSFVKYAANPLINTVTMILIVLGGLGFPVWHDLLEGAKKLIRKEDTPARILRKLKLHTKIVLVMTGSLLFGGALLLFLLEFENAKTIGNLPLGEKMLASLFQSVTTRTAGFATVSQGGLTGAAKFFCCMLMFTGGSPGGTAGGVKTTTMAMLFLNCMAVIRGGEDAECFGRRIKAENIRLGLCIVLIFFGVLAGGTMLITVFEPEADFLSVLYETTSALATVGLTADLTPTLGTPARIILMILMYLGRIGPITLAFAFGAKKNPRDHIRRLPECSIMVG